MNAWRRFIKWCRTDWATSKGDVAVIATALTVVLMAVVALQAGELRQQYPVIDWGSVSDAFAAVGTIGAVIVASWQSIVIRRQAKEAAEEAAEQLQKEIDAANQRTRDEVDAAERRFRLQQEADAERHRAELDAQREVARVQRVHLQEQEFKRALTRVSRAATAYIQELATMVAETSTVTKLQTRQERDDALKPISKTLSALVTELSIEVTGAGMFTNNEQLIAALDRITETAMRGPHAEIEYRNTLTFKGQMPNQAPIFMVMEALPRVIGDARSLAGELLVTGWG